MDILMAINDNFLVLTTAIIVISGIGFFLFGRYRRGHDTEGSIHYALAGLVFGSAVGTALLTISQVIFRFSPLIMYDVLVPLGVTFALFAIAVVVATNTEARRDLQEMTRQLETVLTNDSR
jgi:hypothetical protein